MGESPVDALRKKRDSSIVVATELVREGRAAAVVSAGHTGAAVACAKLNHYNNARCIFQCHFNQLLKGD